MYDFSKLAGLAEQVEGFLSAHRDLVDEAKRVAVEGSQPQTVESVIELVKAHSVPVVPLASALLELLKIV